MKLSPREAMAMAIEEARKGAGFVAPNPLVGCVILDRDGRFLAKGHHARLGGLHAEIHALRQIADVSRLQGAHLFVTLEPCAHHGRQPPCAEHLARLPIASVTYGIQDPNPKVSGRGAEILRGAGKDVRESRELRGELEDLAEMFLVNMRAGRPFVALKVAASLDGKIAAPDGRSQWITGEPARARVQTLRGEHDAVLTGSGTFLRDDPRLNSRDPKFAGKPQRLVLLDPQGECALRLRGSRAWGVRPPGDIFVVCRPEAVKRVPPEVNVIAAELGDDQAFDLRAVLAALREQGIHSLLVEAGPGVLGTFLKQDLADRLLIFVAPLVLGEGLSWTLGLDVGGLERALRLKFTALERVGDDVLLSARPAKGPNDSLNSVND